MKVCRYMGLHPTSDLLEAGVHSPFVWSPDGSKRSRIYLWFRVGIDSFGSRPFSALFGLVTPAQRSHQIDKIIQP